MGLTVVVVVLSLFLLLRSIQGSLVLLGLADTALPASVLVYGRVVCWQVETGTYSVGSVFSPLKMHHAIQASI